MKRIHLLRHAKSSWNDASLADHDRPLSERGEEAGRRMGNWIAEHGLRPQLVVCSTATRTRRTLELVFPSLDAPGAELDSARPKSGRATILKTSAPQPSGSPVPPGAHQPDVTFEAALYHASAEALLDRIHTLDADLDDVMLVGHNPGLQDLALLLSAPSPERERIGAKLPTGALVTIELRVGWTAAGLGDGWIAALVLPREL